ncbi:MAG: hypothetical protein ABIJ39_11580 [Chloroflexota bacterium]
MIDDGNDFNLDGVAPPPAEESNNRTFLIVAGVLAGLVFLTLVCMAIYALVLGPQLQENRDATQAAIATQNLGMQQAMTATADAALWTETPLPSPEPTATNTPSPTPVVVLLTNTPVAAVNLTATYDALQTQFALTQTTSLETPTSTLTTEMPDSGFADEVGLPALIGITGALVVVILLARRLRAKPAE